MVFTPDHRLLYVGASGWVREANGVAKGVRGPLQSLLRDCIKSICPFEYSIKSLAVANEGRVFVIAKARSLLPGWKNTFREIFMFSSALNF
jgi:hypothetical protein